MPKSESSKPLKPSLFEGNHERVIVIKTPSLLSIFIMSEGAYSSSDALTEGQVPLIFLTWILCSLRAHVVFSPKRSAAQDPSGKWVTLATLWGSLAENRMALLALLVLEFPFMSPCTCLVSQVSRRPLW